MSKNALAPIPSYLETPPISTVNSPPIQTRLQELPFGELIWENFEKLCFRLIRFEADVKHCQLYGTPGQKQGGIDIYARSSFSDNYKVYQCKRVTNFGPSLISKAVDKFLEGEWASKTDTFVLCTKESLIPKERADGVEAQAKILREKGIRLLIWDCNQLSLKLKEHPKLVDDFFSREWVKAFCGEDEAQKLGNRLDAIKVIEFRQKFALFYKNVFNAHDPGLPIPSADKAHILSLEERYVVPDIYEETILNIPHGETDTNKISEGSINQNEFYDTLNFENKRQLPKTPKASSTYRQRKTLETWLVSSKRNIILGGPGSGKSALLRFLITDSLKESPRLSLFSRKYGQFLPVWIPFALWTKLIAEETASCSLEELLFKWLKSWSEERLWPLVKDAFEDERLFLLVDGLDEWTDESAAKIAIDRLNVFISIRKVPAIFTSRSHGFDRLGIQTTDWQIGKICDLSIEQQRELAHIWFSHKTHCLLQEQQCERGEVERKADKETKDFFDELLRTTDLQELGKVPLLLCLLIYHKFFNVRLPQSRFKAYDSLIDHLIAVHPQLRKKAASITETPSDFREDEIKSIFGILAYQIQSHFSEGLIEHDKAIVIIEDYLKDNENGFGFEPREACKHSRKILEIGEISTGLLVKRSPHELAFFHRVFQEYLAAYHLSRLPFNDQVSVIEDHCTNSQWKEVILSLLYIIKRHEEIRILIESIKTKSKSVNIAERYSIELLLCETVLGDFNCPVSLSRELAKEVFTQIEEGTWMPHRARLLNHVLDGLRSSKLKETVKQKLRSWFPCRSSWSRGIFEAMGNWEKSQEVIECLWKGMHDEEVDNQRAAARALAKIAVGDIEVGNRIAFLARTIADPIIGAVAIEALLDGWQDHKDIAFLLNESHNSFSNELRFISIYGRILKGIQTVEDLHNLMKLGSNSEGLGFIWRDDIASAFIRGWPKSQQIKTACLEALKRFTRDEECLEREIAFYVLLEGYPQDKDIAQFIANEFTNEKFPLLSMGEYNSYRLLSNNFKNHPLLIEPIDKWIEKQKFKEPEISFLALIGCTQTAKNKLLSQSSFWAVGALLEGWGMQDAEIAKKLTEIAYGPNNKACEIAQFIPQIIDDKTTCRKRLLELLKDSECKRPDFVLDGLNALGENQDDLEIIELIVNRLDYDNREYWLFDNIMLRLFKYYSSYQRVRDIAKKELDERDGNYASVASTYGFYTDIQQKLIDISFSLPVNLRDNIATRLASGVGDTEFTLSLLKLYDYETDAGIKTQSAINYHNLLITTGKDVTAALDYLAKSINCVGFDYEERRQAVFCGLLVLNRLDIMTSMLEKDTLGFSFTTRGGSHNIPLLKLMWQKAGSLRAVLGSEFLDKIFKPYFYAFDFWETSCLLVDEISSLREEIFMYLENNPKDSIGPNMLRFIGKYRPQSSMLIENCFNQLYFKDDHYKAIKSSAILAAELIGEHLGGDKDVLKQIISKFPIEKAEEPLIVVLCEGWPESEELQKVFEIVRKDERPLSYAAYFQLISRMSASEILFNAIIKHLSRFNHRYKWVLHGTIRPITRRLKDDGNLHEMLMKKLKNANPPEKTSIPRLLYSARGMSDELRAWCIEEVNSQLNGKDFPEVGFDWITGEIRPVAHSILDILSGTQS